MARATISPDLLRRFTPTPLVADLQAMGRGIHLETNSETVLDQIKSRLACYGGAPPHRLDFQWRIVAEPGSSDEPAWPEMTAFSREGLSFAAVGHRGFLAVDSDEREAVAFLPEGLVTDGLGFCRPFLAMLFSLTSRAVGLTPLAAASVAQGETGLLILGPAQSGKTLCSYLAGRAGLQFHADQMVFLEANAVGLCAWGEFWPALFYDDAPAFLPELPAVAQPYRYQARSYFCLEKPQPTGAHGGVIPVACVFLERQNLGAPQMTPLRSEDFQCRLNEYGRLGVSGSLERREDPTWNLLRHLPAFHLTYGGDPRALAGFFHDLIASYSR